MNLTRHWVEGPQQARVMTTLRLAIRLAIPLSETEYNSGCQNQCYGSCWILWCLQDIQGIQESYLRPISLSSSSVLQWLLGNTKNHKASGMCHFLGTCPNFSTPERHTVPQEPQTLTWKICGMFLKAMVHHIPVQCNVNDCAQTHSVAHTSSLPWAGKAWCFWGLLTIKPVLLNESQASQWQKIDIWGAPVPFTPAHLTCTPDRHVYLHTEDHAHFTH